MTAVALDLLLRSSALLALVWLAFAGVAAAGGSAAMRHAVLAAGLVALASIPALGELLPPLKLAVLPATAAPVSNVGAVAGLSEPAAPSLAGADSIIAIYLVGALCLLGRIALGRALLARMWRAARPAADWQPIVDQASAMLGIRRPVRLRLAAGACAPMTWGTRRPRLLLPSDARCWDEHQRRIVVLHELAHVARRDSLSRTVAAIVCAAYWYHPLAWAAAGRMRLEQEHACDDLVLALGTEAGRYARSLVEIARGAPPPARATAMVRASELERRLTAIARSRPRSRASARFVTGTNAVGLAAATLVAIIVPVAPLASGPLASPRIAAMDELRAAPGVEEPSPRIAIAPAAPAAPPARGLVAPANPGSQASPAIPAIPASPAIPAVPAVPANARTPTLEAMAHYRAEMERFERELEAYRAETLRYQREVAAYERRMAEIGPDPAPGTTQPAYPTAPTYPTHPGAPPAG